MSDKIIVMLKQKILTIINNKPSNTYFALLQNLKNQILDQTIFLNKKENVTFNERVFVIINDIILLQTCLECNNPVKFINYNKGYRKYCSHKCSRSSELTLEKRINTMTEKYGVENIMFLDKSKNKIKETSKKKYGFEHHSKSEKQKKKVKAHMKEKKAKRNDVKKFWRNN